MSYILEALKKADAERKLGAVPGLHMQSVPTVMFEDSIPLIRRPLTWVVLALILTGVILLAWHKPWSSHDAPVQSKSSLSSAAVNPADESTSAPVAVLSGNQVDSSLKATPEKDELVNAKENRSAQPSGEPGKAAEKAEKTERKPSTTSRTSSPPQEVKTTAAAPAKQPQQAATNSPEHTAELQVAALRDLPEHVQRSLPQVMVGGYIYSSKPAERSMLINNRLVREGESITSGLVLEKMLPNREAILNFQGQRYRLPY
jgi:general secretion pathway protein B